MNSHLPQGTKLRAIMTPDYNGECVFPFISGVHGVKAIYVSQLAGPMGWYDVAVIEWSNETPDQIIPLHMADLIQLEDTTND